MGSFLRYFNSLEFIANNYCTYKFSDIDLFDIIDTLHSVSFDDVKGRLDEHLDVDGMAISAVRPRNGTGRGSGNGTR